MTRIFRFAPQSASAERLVRKAHFYNFRTKVQQRVVQGFDVSEVHVIGSLDGFRRAHFLKQFDWARA